MKAILSDTLMPLWQLPVRERDNRATSRSARIGVLLGVSSLFLLAGALALVLGSRRAFLPLVFPATGVLLYVWYVFVDSMANLVTPANLTLLPGLRTRVAWATVSMWLLLAVLLGTFLASPEVFPVLMWCIAVALLMPWRRFRILVLLAVCFWIAFSMTKLSLLFRTSTSFTLAVRIEMLVLIVAGSGTLFGLAGLLRPFPKFGAALWIAWLTLITYGRELVGISFDALLKFFYDMSSPLTTHLAIALTLLALTLYGLLGRGVNRRAGRVTREIELNYSHSTGGGASAAPGWRWHNGALYRRSLEKRLAKSHQVSKHDRLPLVAYVFGQSVHLSVLLEAGLIIAVPAALAPLFIGRFATGEIAPAMAMLLPVGALIGTGKALEMAVWHTRREQQMLSLTPGWPGSADVKSSFTRFLVGYTVSMFAIFGGTMLFAMWVNHSPFDSFLPPLAALTAGAILMMGAVLRDYSRMHEPGTASDLAKFAIGLLPLALLQFTRLANGPVESVALLLIAVSVAFAAWRAMRYARVTNVLPAGALAVRP